MKALKIALLVVGAIIGLSSCVVPVPVGGGPGYYRGGPVYRGPVYRGGPGYYGGGPRYHHGGGGHHGHRGRGGYR